jgi:membrane protease YdiL (CAAX protease family)
MLIIGILAAFLFWFLMFAGFTELTHTIHNNYFWYVMTPAAASLAIFALYNEKSRFKELFRFEWKYLWIGLIHAILLYLLSRFGVWLFVQFFDWTIPQIQAIYQTRTQAEPMLIAALLLFVIAPAEEIFWRAFVQERLIQRFDIKYGTIIAVGLYTFVHIWAFNPMLLLAALVLGIHWSLIYAKYRNLIPGIISHALWDVLIFVVIPINL